MCPLATSTGFFDFANLAPFGTSYHEMTSDPALGAANDTE